MNYQVSEFEQQHINKIKEELEKYPNITAMEKAYYIYNYSGYEKLEGNKRKIGYAINKMQKECEVPEH